ncbi:MAG: PhnD/SsuA/transferrin family substrate-binding protein [Gammaproteobacteria bacterium]|nr:PhnD/SsuA/transferrin family substrate-binding protein [Gammaproteobacteria bacterium]
MKLKSTLAVFLGLIVVSVARVPAADTSGTQNLAPMQISAAAIKKVSFAPSTPAFAKSNLPASIAEDRQTLVFTAPPLETEAEAVRTYQPIAQYLSRIIGKTIVFQYPKDWLTYQKEMQRGNYDLVFDGPHFNSWRHANLQHSTLVKLADDYTFAVVVRKNDRITELKQLAGQKICGMTPPDIGTLAVLGQFDNPARQPLIINTPGATKVYESVAVEKQCAAGILPVASLRKIPDSENLVRVIHKTRSMPNQAFSAGPRISREDQALIAAALVSPGASRVVRRLVAEYGDDRGLAYASTEEYAGLDAYLKDTWGYSH